MPAVKFNVCPQDARFAGRLGYQPKPRRPFAERAAALAQESSRYRAEAARFVGQERFRLGQTDFEIKGRSVRLSDDNKAALYAYAACLGAPRVSLRLGDLKPDMTMISLHATETIADKPGQNNVLLVLEFSFSSFATLNSISSWGLGGKALAVFYNFVRDMGAEKIVYFMDRKNVEALGFYVHTDFGGPVDQNAHRWELDIVSVS